MPVAAPEPEQDEAESKTELDSPPPLRKQSSRYLPTQMSAVGATFAIAANTYTRASLFTGDTLNRTAEDEAGASRRAGVRARLASATMIRPGSTFRLSWDLIVSLCLGYIAISLPYRMGFRVDPTGSFFVFELFIDVYFCVDVLLNFRTGYHAEDGKEVMAWRQVARNYTRSWFCIDVVSSIPWDLIFEKAAAGATQSARLSKSLKLGKGFRVLKLARLARLAPGRFASEWSETLEEMMASWAMHSIMMTARLVMLTFFVSHLIACSWAYCSELGEHSGLQTYSDGPYAYSSEQDDDGDEGSAMAWALRRKCACGASGESALARRLGRALGRTRSRGVWGQRALAAHMPLTRAFL